MGKIYVPELSNYQCYVITSSDTIRAYKQTPTYNSTIEVRDYYIKSNYIYRDGYQSFGSYNYTTLPVCLSQSVLTDEVYYRNDFPDILLMLLIVLILCFMFPLKVFLRLFRRFL